MDGARVQIVKLLGLGDVLFVDEHLAPDGDAGGDIVGSCDHHAK
jgi:hypothetical protein